MHLVNNRSYFSKIKSHLGFSPKAIIGILIVLLVLLMVISVPYRNMGLEEAYYVLYQDAIGGISKWWENEERMVFAAERTREESLVRILYNWNLPRTLGAVLVGGSLAAAGAVYQGIFRNPLVSPDLLGASSGAAFGGALAIFFYWTGVKSLLVAFACSLLAVLIVYLISLAVRENQTLTLLLAGIMVSSLFSAGINVLKTFAPADTTIPSIVFWLMGAISPGFNMRSLQYLILPVFIGLLILYVLRWKINLMTLGEDEARSMGINPVIIRGIVIFAATLITAASVSICGTIGWVGLVVPHVVRKLVGPDFRVLLPASVVLGGIIVLFLDNMALMHNPVMPLGVFTGFVGVPFYLLLLLDRRKAL